MRRSLSSSLICLAALLGCHTGESSSEPAGEAALADAEKVDHTDGVGVDFEDWRFNLRKSNTEPLIRLNVETRGDRDRLRRGFRGGRRRGRDLGHGVAGTPADCVKLAASVLLESPPDLIGSGINLGPNLGTDVIYSGTVGAALGSWITSTSTCSRLDAPSSFIAAWRR